MRTLVLASNSHRSRSTPGWEAPRPPPGVMEMRPAACQRKRHLDRRWQRHFDFRLPQSRDAPRRDRGEIGRSDHARLGSPTGKTDDVIELKSSVRRAAARGFTVDLALIHTTSTTCLAWIFQHCLYDHMHDYPAQWVPPHPQLARGRMSPAVELRAFGSAATAPLLSDPSSWKWLSRTWLLPAPTFRQFRRHRQTDPATPWEGSWPPHTRWLWSTMWCPADATAVELGVPPRNGRTHLRLASRAG